MHHVLQGDSAVVLGHVADNSIHAVVTDPPHGLFFMGSQWDADLPEQRIWEECFRVLKPGGHAFVMSSERLGCVAGLYMSLRKAGFEVDETQILNWVSLTGMPKSSDIAKTADKRAFRAWLDHVGADLTNAERRKAASAAVNGEFDRGRDHDQWHYDDRSVAGAGMHDAKACKQRHSEGVSLLTRLLALHWPASPAARREHWEAVVPDVPEEWDCSRPPGVRVKTVPLHGDRYPNGPKGNTFSVGEDPDGTRDKQQFATAPSTPDAVRFDGWRGSVAPLKPFCYPILHAQKPREGSYLDNMREWGVGAVAIDACRVPFGEEGAWSCPEAPRSNVGHKLCDDNRDREGPHANGRTPANLLSYADLLGDLQRYADLSAWCEALDLPEEAADLLEAGFVYSPKPSRAEKSCGGEVDCTHPTCKPAALCAYLVTLATREGQTILDPFCGSGSTGVACAAIGRGFIGIDLSDEYCAIARARIDYALGIDLDGEQYTQKQEKTHNTKKKETQPTLF